MEIHNLPKDTEQVHTEISALESTLFTTMPVTVHFPYLVRDPPSWAWVFEPR